MHHQDVVDGGAARPLNTEGPSSFKGPATIPRCAISPRTPSLCAPGHLTPLKPARRRGWKKRRDGTEGPTRTERGCRRYQLKTGSSLYVPAQSSPTFAELTRPSASPRPRAVLTVEGLPDAALQRRRSRARGCRGGPRRWSRTACQVLSTTTYTYTWMSAWTGIRGAHAVSSPPLRRGRPLLPRRGISREDEGSEEGLRLLPRMKQEL